MNFFGIVTGAVGKMFNFWIEKLLYSSSCSCAQLRSFSGLASRIKRPVNRSITFPVSAVIKKSSKLEKISLRPSSATKDIRTSKFPRSPASRKETISVVKRIRGTHSRNSEKSTNKTFKSKKEKVRAYFSSLPAQFRLNPKSNLSVIDDSLRGKSTWEGFLFSDELVKGVREGLGLKRPNYVQSGCIPSIMKSNSQVLCAAETGSGKTLAYLLPIISKLKEQERLNENFIREDGYPRAIILVPSNELVHQVYSVAKTIAHFVKLRVECVRGGDADAKRFRDLTGKIDLLISTPSKMLTLSGEEGGLFRLDRVSHLVIDEGDSLLSADFGTTVKNILGKTLKSMDTIVVASATIPFSLTNTLQTMFPSMQRLGSSRLHCPPNQASVRFISLDSRGRLPTLRDLLLRYPQQSTLIFCNRAARASLLHTRLTEDTELIDSLGHVPSLLHGHIPEKQRQSIVRKFMERDIKFLVCTDIASRGLDTTQVTHVIMYDFPRNTIDFIHRMGRTGRRRDLRGLVTCMYSREEEKLAVAIKTAVKSGQALTNHFE